MFYVEANEDHEATDWNIVSRASGMVVAMFLTEALGPSAKLAAVKVCDFMNDPTQGFGQ